MARKPKASPQVPTPRNNSPAAPMGDTASIPASKGTNVANFNALLNRRPNEVEKPKPLPVGDFLLSIAKYEFGESKEKKTPYVRFTLNVLAPGEDVDPDALTGVDLSKKQLRLDFYITEDALWRLTEFLTESLGLDAGLETTQLIDQSVGMSFYGAVTQRPDKNSGAIYNDVGATRKAE